MRRSKVLVKSYQRIKKVLENLLRLQSYSILNGTTARIRRPGTAGHREGALSMSFRFGIFAAELSRTNRLSTRDAQTDTQAGMK